MLLERKSIILVKIRPWPFGEKTVYLHWIGNVKMKNNQWYIQVAFVNNMDVRIIDLPIGILPTLKIGVPYKDGMPLNTQKEGTFTNVRVEDFSLGTMNKAIDICRRLNIFLYKRPELMNQNIWSFKSNSLYYHIPHSEVIRAFYAPNKTLANALLRPNGLDLLINQSSILNNGDTAYVDFADEIPGSILTKDFVNYFSWLYFNDSLRQSFASVQSNAYTYGLNKGALYGIPLEVTPPPIGEITIEARAVQKNNEVLIFEILGIDGAAPPFFEIQYRHKSNKKYINTNKPRKKRLSKTEEQSEYVLNEKDGERSREDTNQPVIDLDPMQIAFRHSTVVTRIPKQEQKVNQGDEYISNVGRGGGIKQQVVGVDESLFGSKIAPIEFNSLEVTNTYTYYGLDNFIAMIRYLSENNQHLIVSINFIFLPIGRKFSILPDGRRRICVIVKVINGGKKSYILEVAVPDKKTISTLIVPISGDKNKDEEKILKLLEQLVYHGGNWSLIFLKGMLHKKLKHGHIDPQIWSYRVKEWI